MRAEIFQKGQKMRSTNQELPAIKKVTKLWNKNGHQNNSCRIAVVQALMLGHSQYDIVRAVRFDVFSSEKNPWNGIAKNDTVFWRIAASILRIKKAHDSGKLTGAKDPIDKSDLQSKTVIPNSRGRKPTDVKRVTEDKLMSHIKTLWSQGKIVTRHIVFHAVMKINPQFLGGVKSSGHLAKLRDWFYLGLKKRYNLS